MESVIRSLKKGEAFGLLYLVNFILSFHLFFVVYINSSFIGTLIREDFLGTIWIIGSILGIGALLLMSRALRILGNYRLVVLLTFLEMLLFVGLAVLKNPYLVITTFITYLVIYPLILFNLDIFLESFIKEESKTGGIRGIFLTITNSALIIAPLLAGLILTNGDYWKVYLISAVLLIPFLVLISKFRHFKDPQYNNLKIFQTLRCIWVHKNTFRIFMAQFLLRFLFSWMVIYMPIYLHGHIGFSWSEFGIMTAIMLLPFALFELPAGKIADGWWGEKELLSVGFIIAGLFAMMVPFITTTSFFVWTALMFSLRIGASLIEITTESYFFKHVDGDDNNTISFFRITRPLGYIIGPVVATFALLFMDLQYIFFILGIILLFGLFYSLKIEDTR